MLQQLLPCPTPLDARLPSPTRRCLRPPAPQDLGVFDYDTGLCINGWGPVNTDFCDCVPTKTECTDCKE